MRKTIKVKCPAKINLSLKVTEKREDGFHNIDSVMQTINLYDYLTISIEPAQEFCIELSGNSNEIPYDEKNLVYKAADSFLCTLSSKIEPQKILIYIEKNIPVAAGLAGGSTDAAGVLHGLNEIFSCPLARTELHEHCARLGSDLNFCLEGGKQRATGRGEILEPLDFEDFELSLIKPVSLGISAKEAYTKFSQKKAQGLNNYGFVNDLEWALINDYPELSFIKSQYKTAVMSGSGSTYFGINTKFSSEDGYWVKNGLRAIDCGVSCVPTTSI